MPYADPAKRAELQRRLRNAPPLPIRYGSAPCIALGYLKMVRRPVGTGELRALSPRLRDARAALDKLASFGYATLDWDGRATVTEAGVAALYELGKRHALNRRKGEQMDDEPLAGDASDVASGV